MMQRLFAFLAIVLASSISLAEPTPTLEVESGTLCESRSGERSALDSFKLQVEYSPEYVVIFVEYKNPANKPYQFEIKQMVVVKKPILIQDFTISGRNSTTGPDTVCAKIVHVK